MTNEELDRLAALKIMGWFEPGCINARFSRTPEFPWSPVDNWYPTTDWQCAGEIVEKMTNLGYELDIDGSHPYAVEFYKLGDSLVRPFQSHYGPRAITIAALRAVGAIKPEDVA